MTSMSRSCEGFVPLLLVLGFSGMARADDAAEAEKAFHDMREGLYAAPSMCVTFDGSVEHGSVLETMEGSLEIDVWGRLSLKVRLVDSKSKMSRLTILASSDGTTLTLKREGVGRAPESEALKAPASLRENVLLLYACAGAYAGTQILCPGADGLGSALPWDEDGLGLHNFAKGAADTIDGHPVQAIEFDAGAAGAARQAHVTLWLDKVSGQTVRTVARVSSGKDITVVTELVRSSGLAEPTTKAILRPVGGTRQIVQIDIAKLVDGHWLRQRCNVRPGDGIGRHETLFRDKKAQEVDFSTGFTLVEILAGKIVCRDGDGQEVSFPF